MFQHNPIRTITRLRRAPQTRLTSVLLVVASLCLTAWVAVGATETVESGNLNGRALSLPTPVYPLIAKQSRVVGMVKVDIVVNETGKVEVAKASSGPTLLRQAAMDAAQKAKFAPTLKAGAPVRVTGFLQYEFKLD